MANKQTMTKIPVAALNPEIQAAPNMEYEVKPIPLNGKWAPASNPALIGTNFKTLTNMRYVEGHPESIMGMTKINTSALVTNLKPKNAYYFSKELYTDYHLLTQVYDSAGTTSVIKDNHATIPSAEGYLELLELSVAPATVWREGATLTGSTTGVTCVIVKVLSAYKYIIKSRTGTFAHQIPDSQTKFLCHFDGANGSTADLTAESGQTVSLEGGAALSTTEKKFGSACITFSGETPYATVPASADWNFGTDPFTLQFYLHTHYSGNAGFYGQFVDTNNYWYWRMVPADGTNNEGLKFKVVVDGVTKAEYIAYWTHQGHSSNSWNFTIAPYHLELGRDGANVYMFWNGVKLTLTTVTPISTNAMPDFTATSPLYLGACGETSAIQWGWGNIGGGVGSADYDEMRVTKGACLHSATFTPPTEAYHFLVNEALSDGTTSSTQTGIYPTVEDYCLFEETVVNGGMFSGSPNGEVVYCNGVDNCIWDGYESRVPAILTAGATMTAATDIITTPMDVTAMLSKKLNTPDNIIIFGDNASTMDLYGSFDGASSADPHTMNSGNVLTFTGGLSISTGDKKFGTASCYGDGDGCYGTIPKADKADWELGNSFTISFHANLSRTSSRNYYFVGQYTDANNYWHLTAARYYGFFLCYDTWTFSAKTTGGVLVNYTWVKHHGTGDGTGWHHYALVRSNTSLEFYCNGKVITGRDKTIINDIASQTIPNIDDYLYLGGQPTVGKYLYGYMDDFYVDKNSALYTSNFTAPSAPLVAAMKTILIGTTRPATGAKFYLATPNIATSKTMSGKYYNSSGWRTMDIIDHTDLGTATLGQDGWVTWGTPVDEEPKYIEGYYLYWYQLTISGGSSMIYHITTYMPFQNIQDVWDGNFLEIASCFKQADGQIYDNTLNVMNIDDYIADDEASYLKMDTFDDTDEIFVAFSHQITGLYIDMPENRGNTNASVIKVYLWTGIAWQQVSNLIDGTDSSGDTLTHTGVVTWSAPAANVETKRSMYGSFPLYFYRIMVTAELDGDCRINYISAIPTPSKVEGYSFSIHAADRLMLGCDNYYAKNQLWVSAQDRPEVFNGTDSQKILFGGNGALTCGTSVFAQYASNIYNIILIYKATETWIMQWNQSSSGTSWSRFCISPNVGCPAPRTLCTASVVFENNINQVKNVAIWRAQDGIYISNGQSPFKVSKDIDNVFDRYAATHVNMAMVPYEFSFVDEEMMEYHWLWASGSSTSLDKEYVLDLQEWKWYEIDRGTGNYLQCGVTVNDSSGNKYNYGLLDSGYTERLEYGATMDGGSLISTMEFGEIVPSDNVVMLNTMAMVNLICVPKATDTSVVMTHYLDGLLATGTPSGTDYTFTISDSTHAYANVMKDVFSKPAIFHRMKFVHTSTVETKGFEPLYLNVYSQKSRLHTR